MVNSLHAAYGSKAFDTKTVQKSGTQMIQSIMDRVYAVLKDWDNDVASGPSLYRSICWLCVTKGVYKRIDTCPDHAQKILHRLLSVIYKNGLPMSDKIFGLTEGGDSYQSKRKRHQPKSTSDN